MSSYPNEQGAMDAIDAGLSRLANPDPKAEQVKQHVKMLFETIDQARKFDEEARKGYAKDRRYARGDTGFEVDSNIIGTFIEILTAFLYARDPDVDVLPSESSIPPDPDAIMELAEKKLAGTDQMMAQMAVMTVEQHFEDIQRRYRKRQRDNKAFAETLAIIVSRLWSDAKIKRQAKRWVRSCLTIGVGWLKASWQTRTAADPVMSAQINDLQDNIKRVLALREQMEDESACADLDAKRQQYEQMLKGLQGGVERVIARGFVADMVPAEDIQVAIDVASLSEYVEAPWISHRSFPRAEQAKAMFGLSEEQMKKAARYAQRKPILSKSVSPAVATDVSADEADLYTAAGAKVEGKAVAECVRVEEFWSRDDNRVYTLIEGLEGYAREPWSPKPTTRFYPFFLFCTSETDGQRHPQSLTSRSYRLVDEVARVRTNYAEHRRRTVPKTAFNAAVMDQKEAAKLAGATTQEMVAVHLNEPGIPIGDVIQPIAYAGLDPHLYETGSIMQELERIWGVQEALAQSISVAKTATEAEIQQAGFHARTGAMRDALDDALIELARYTAEVALTNMSREDAQHIAGPDAFWPEQLTAEELPQLVKVEVRAGSSGKPNTSSEREAWATLLPLLQQAIQTIGQLRQSPPAEMADKFEALLRETAVRAGDRLEVDRLIPQGGAQAPPPGAEAAVPGQPLNPAMPASPPQWPNAQPPTTDPLTV